MRASVWKKEICSISSRSRVLAHRPCPKLEMFCPSVLQLFYGCSKVLMTNHGMSFFCFCFLFFKPAGDPSSATLVPDLAKQVWPFKSALFKTSRPHFIYDLRSGQLVRDRHARVGGQSRLITADKIWSAAAHAGPGQCTTFLEVNLPEVPAKPSNQGILNHNFEALYLKTMLSC